MRYLKQSTEVTKLIGPFLDKTDGVTEESGLAGAGTEISKNGAAFGAGPVLGTHDSDGWYPITLTTTHTNTIGDLIVKVHDSATHLPVWVEFHVLVANVYDSLFGAGTDKLDVNVEEWNTTAVPSEHTAGYPIVTVKDGTGTGEINTNAGAIALVDLVTTTTTATNVTTVNGLAAGVITATSIAADAITDAKVASDVTIASVTGAVGSVTGAVGSVTGSVGSVVATVSADVVSISGDTAAADNAESYFDGTGYGDVLQRTTIATLASQTSFTLTAGSADNDAYNDCIIVIQDATTAAQKAVAVVDDYTGSTKTVTLRTDPAVFTMATSDIVTILADRSLKPTVMNRTLDVTATGAAGIDWANVEAPTTTLALTGTTIATTQKVDVETIKTQSVACGAGVTVGAYVGQGTAAIGVNASGHVSRVTLADTVTTLTGHTAQTGDTYAVVASGTYGNSALKTLIDAVDDYVDSEVSAIKTVTDRLSGMLELDGAVYRFTTNSLEQSPTGSGGFTSDDRTTLEAIPTFSEIWTTALTEAYASDGAAFTPAQGLFMIWSALSQFAVSSTTITCKKLDGTTTSMTFSMDSATAPTSRTRNG